MSGFLLLLYLSIFLFKLGRKANCLWKNPVPKPHNKNYAVGTQKPTVPEEVLQYEAPVDLDKLLEDVTLSKLNDIFKQVMQRVEDKVDPIRSKFGKIEKEEVNLPEKMEYVKEYARNHKHFSFKDLLLQQTGKMQVIVTFLAILELMKIGFINIIQEEIFDDILIDLAE